MFIICLLSLNNADNIKKIKLNNIKKLLLAYYFELLRLLVVLSVTFVTLTKIFWPTNADAVEEIYYSARRVCKHYLLSLKNFDKCPF